MSFIRTLCVFASALAVLCSAVPVFAKPPIFAELAWQRAVEKGRQSGKLVVIDAMASWCPPCKAMDRRTWTNQSLTKWMRENCIAVQFDVDRDPVSMKALKVRAMPTIIIYADGEELAREVGGFDAKDMLEWLQALQKHAGLNPVKETDQTTREGRDGGSTTPGGREAVSENARKLKEARALAAKDKHQEAALAFAALWKSLSAASIPDENVMAEAAADMRLLVKNFPGAKKTFAELRDASAPKPGNPLAILPGDLLTWTTLNAVLGEGEKTLAWFDQAKPNPAAKPYVLKIDGELGPELVKAKRWADIAWLVRAALEAGDVRFEHVEWLEEAEKSGAANTALLTEARAKAV
jgi:thiol-disulfide isomerase/thioredoxin